MIRRRALDIMPGAAAFCFVKGPLKNSGAPTILQLTLSGALS